MKTSSGGRSLDVYLAQHRATVDAALERFLPDASTRPYRLHEAMRYSVFGGGKRLRPILALASHELAGGEGDAVLAPAAATELIHTYSLIHDDLPAMDDDELRRGRPTCHVAHGEAMAILAGDGLVTLAFEVLAAGYEETPGLAVEMVGVLARAAGVYGMVSGQVLDLAAERQEERPEDPRALLETIHWRKTGVLLEGCALMGGCAGGASPLVGRQWPSNWSIPTALSTTTCPPWTMTICAGAGPLHTSCSARQWQYSSGMPC